MTRRSPKKNGRRASEKQKIDKHRLYEIAVQDPKGEVAFIRKAYRRFRNREARSLREDFCGTAHLACEWVRRVGDGEAVGIDLDAATLQYAREHKVARLGDRASRVRLVRANVLDGARFRPDVVVAFNFSYMVFKQRPEILRYFKGVKKSVSPDGLFILDLYGGPESQAIQEEETDHDDFTFVWDQAAYNPITGEALCHIHFDLPDGRRLRNAFTYDWRLWSLPEVRDLLGEAGFDTVEVYWEGTDRSSGGGNGVFRPSVKGDDSACWVVYIVAVPGIRRKAAKN
jgi:SAM-dependent methyltransferase